MPPRPEFDRDAPAAPRTQSECGNLLLRALAPEDFERLRPSLQPVPLEDGDVIAAQGEPITFVCFPECGVTSIADVQSDGSRVEVALIGREGMTNAPLLLGCEEAQLEATVLIGRGRSLRVEADELRDFCADSPGGYAVFLRFIHTLSVQTARTLASNVRDLTEKRLSRWLLMCHDRIEGDALDLSHEQIARMLCVRRATVTDTLHSLEGVRAIRNTRGQIIVRDRAALLDVAGDSYGFPEEYYRKVIGAFGKNEHGGMRAAPPGTGRENAPGG